MTTEDDFQAQLDAEPDNHTLRTIFADWLDDMGDPRGPGYRALGARGNVPNRMHGHVIDWYWSHAVDTLGHCYLTPDWFAMLDLPGTKYKPELDSVLLSRRAAEDAAALAFAKLPEARQAELLASRLEAVEAPV